MNRILSISLMAVIFLACAPKADLNKETEMEKKVNQFASVKLTADLSHLTPNQKEMIRLFIEASEIMDDLFWKQSYGDKNTLLDTIHDEYLKKFIVMNYGPWERLNNNIPFIRNINEKPKGAAFYPTDMTQEEFKNFNDSSKTSQYTVIKRDSNRNLITVPYHILYKEELQRASALLQKAAMLSDNEGLTKYLKLRAEALLSDNYQPSDIAWMDMKTNLLDIVIGPIETYEDELYEYKASYEAYVLIKDNVWSERLSKYAKLLPEMQSRLPVAAKYKAESPGMNSDLGAYDVLYYAGHCNAGSKTIAINLPNDEEIQLAKGSRRLQLKNAIQAKYEKIMLPIAGVLIDEGQMQHLSFDAFFSDIMFHEVAHGLGIKNTINGKETVRLALKDQYSALEEGKADILGLFLITQLNEMGILKTDPMDNYVTFLAGLFRSIRFGASSAHGRANLIRFNYFREKGAFTRNARGKYAVNFLEMKKAMNQLSEEIITIQGNGDYDAAKRFSEKYGVLSEELKNDLSKLSEVNIPVDIVFEQGISILHLKN